MKLFSSTRSPFARKVLICAREVGVIDRLEIVPKVVSFLKADREIGLHNPLGQIPTLLLDDGSALYDSGVICDYLAALNPERGLVPDHPMRRRDMLRRQALADGLMANFMRWYGERRRAEEPLSPAYVEVCRGKLIRGLDAWNVEAAHWSERPFDLGVVATGCALAYADFRFAAEDWRANRPVLAAWYDQVAARASFVATAFQDA